MAFVKTDWFYFVDQGVIDTEKGKYPRPGKYGAASPDSTLSAKGDYRLWEDKDTPNPYGPYASFTAGSLIVDETGEGDGPRVTQLWSWTDATTEQKRQRIRNTIESDRIVRDELKIDRLRDPGLVSQVDEANAGAVERHRALGLIAEDDDAALDAFDTTPDAENITAQQIAESLYNQEQALLVASPNMPQAQIDEVEAAKASHAAVMASSNPHESVVAPPPFARRTVGVFAEDYGVMEVKRIQREGVPTQWCPVFKLTIDRQLTPGEHWIWIGSDAADGPDVIPDLNKGYLTTAQLTETGEGVYEADTAAVNLWYAQDFEFRHTLCEGHLINPRFPVMILEPNDNYEIYRVRWGGEANGVGSNWVDTGQTVDTIPFGNGIRIQDTTGFTVDQVLKINEIEGTITQVFNATDLVVSTNYDSSAVGHIVYRQE